MRVPNNAEQIAERIREEFDVNAVADDGSVCINEIVSARIREMIFERYATVRVGDGVQEGSIWVNDEECE